MTKEKKVKLVMMMMMMLMMMMMMIMMMIEGLIRAAAYKTRIVRIRKC
jgi:hypothetical protein